ncbi:MAG TPA: hypothetical protein VEQ34_11160, partial [Pyrinomonadaceae bacterium]|nr:hypothetical protein [Pyrinomonadaceae bacterium]
MEFIAHAEVEASFRPLERKLDAMLEEARARLNDEGIAVRDESNRTGFGGGFSDFVWAFDFEKREDYGSEIKRAKARLWYFEPDMKGEPRKIEVTSVAEIFQIGKQSRVYEVSKVVYPIEQFLNLKM